LETVRELFARRGLRCTRQREQVYSALAATKAHPTAEELFDMVRADAPGVSLATVYNALDAFAGAGICRRMPCPSGGCRFDADTAPHAHLVTSDGRIVDLPEDLSARLLASFSPDDLAELERHTGVCLSGLSLQVMGEPRRG
jgi:Fur family peroxide stress response transcriptional regulator